MLPVYQKIAETGTPLSATSCGQVDTQLVPCLHPRLQRGAVLRILDSKSPTDRSLVQSAPRFRDSLTTAAQDVSA